jgi:hypothetical protein
VKKLPLTFLLATIVFASSAQDTASRKKSKTDKKDVRRQKINTLIKQSEEGVLIYSKQSIFGLQGRTNGFGAFYEIGRMKSNRKTNTYRLDFTEIKHQKEEKSQSAGLIFSNPYIYGKINHFYQATLGFGQQYILGQKGNKNGVAGAAIFNGGTCIGSVASLLCRCDRPISGKQKQSGIQKPTVPYFWGPALLAVADLEKAGMK